MNNQQNTGNKKNTLLSDDNNYTEALQTYYGYMKRLTPQTDWMKNKFGVRISGLFDVKKDIKVLGIGSGSGEFDIDVLNQIVKCGKEKLGDGYSVLYQVVEPNACNVEVFRNAVSQNPEYKKIQFKWCTGYFDKFCDDFKQKEADGDVNKFDFVHFVRCFYHINSVEAFDHTHNHLLAKNGIVCAIGENEGFWPKIMQFLADHKMEHEAFTCSGPVSQNYFLPGWQQQARDRDWRYESYVHGYNFDITPMYDASSKDGNHLIDFAMHSKLARKTVEASIMDDFFKFLDNGKVEEEIIENGAKVKKIHFRCEFGAIMITKD